MGVQEYRACLHLRLLFTLLMISMLDSINISVAQSWNLRSLTGPHLTGSKMALNLAEALENPVLRRLRPTRWHLEWCCGYHVRETSRASHGLRVTISCSSTYSMRSTRWRRSAISPKPHSVAASRRLCGCEAAATPTSRSCWIAVSPALYVRTSIHRTMHGRSCRPASSRRSADAPSPADTRSSITDQVPQQEAISLLNANTLVVCMIESLEGLANCEAIAAVDGVDVLHVGLTDLLADMGKPGAYGDPQAMAAVTRIAHAAIACGSMPASVATVTSAGRRASSGMV